MFENDDEFSKFLHLVDEFSDMHIDQENLNMEESQQIKLKDKVADQTLEEISTQNGPPKKNK